MASIKIAQGDSVYDTIHTVWVANERSAMFDRQGEWGGALYRVLDTSADYPDFYQIASMPATTFNEDSASETPTQKGWHIVNRDWFYEKMWQNWEGKWKVTRPKIPNKLTPMETV